MLDGIRTDIAKALADAALELADHDPNRVPTELGRVVEEWRERAAIREHVGGMTRLGAEVAAVSDARQMLGLAR